jgi:hypothetical protein
MICGGFLQVAVAVLVVVESRRGAAGWRNVHAHFMVARHVLTGGGVFQAGGILVRGFAHITVQKRISLCSRTKLVVDRSFDDVLGLFGLDVVILRAWIVRRVQVSVGAESVCL